MRILIVLSLILVALVTAAPSAADDIETAAARIDAVASAYTALGRFSGVVLVAKDGKVILSRGYGEANREHHVPVTPRTKFRIASLSKQFTAAAILKLESEGKLAVSDPIVKHLPDYPRPQGEKVTIHHLLSMSSGIPSLYRRGDGLDAIEASGNPVSLDELIAYSSGRDLLFEPGAKYRYSNTGYMILAKIIERVSGLTWAEYMRTAIFGPAKLDDTSVVDDTSVLEHRADGYAGFPGEVRRPPYEHPSWSFGASGVVTTALDLHRWDRVLRTDGLLPAPQRDKFVAHHVDWAGEPDGFYAYGWWGFTRDGRRIVNHGGTESGFVCELYRFPDDDAVVIVLSNYLPKLGVNVPGAIATRAIDILFGDEATPAPPLPASSTTAAPEGTWALDARHTIEIVTRDGRVFATTRGEAPWSLFHSVRQSSLDPTSEAVRTASTILGHLRAGRFGEVAAATMDEWPATAETFSGPWSKWIAAHGEVEAFAPIAIGGNENVDVVTFLVVCQARRGTVDLVLRKDGRLAGWWENFGGFPQEPVELRPAADGTWLAEGFRFGEPDVVLQLDAGRATAEERDWW